MENDTSNVFLNKFYDLKLNNMVVERNENVYLSKQ